MPYEVWPIVIQRLPSGLSGPGGTSAGSSGFSARIEAGTCQTGILALRADLELADQRAVGLVADREREHLGAAAR